MSDRGLEPDRDVDAGLGPSPKPDTRWKKLAVVVPLALLAGLGAASLAPDDWSAGVGSTTLRYQGVEVVTSAITLGDTDSITFEGESGSLAVAVTYPEGVPVDAPIEAVIAMRDDGVAFEPRLEDVALSLNLPDGRVGSSG